MKLDNIKKMFSDRHSSLVDSLWTSLAPGDWSNSFQRKVDEAWAEYLNGLDCTVLGEQEILEDLENIVNHSAQGRICISLEEEYILVPNELAEKALVLGGLPDSWFPEKATT